MLVVPLLAAALGAATASAAGAAAPPAGRVVEVVVAVVRAGPTGTPEVITRTRVEAEARVALVLRGAVSAAFQPLDEGALRAGLVWLLDEWLVAAEAGRLRVQEVDPALVDAEVRRFRAAFGGAGEYARFLATAEVTEDEVREVLARSLRARRFLAARIGPGAAVSEDEVDGYLAARGLSAGTGAARDAVREQLAVESARARVAALVAELRSRAELKILDPSLREPVARREEVTR